jgi:hypothetical protein
MIIIIIKRLNLINNILKLFCSAGVGTNRSLIVFFNTYYYYYTWARCYYKKAIRPCLEYSGHLNITP